MPVLFAGQTLRPEAHTLLFVLSVLAIVPLATLMMLIATMTAALVTNSGRSAWFIGVLVAMVYVIFAMTLYLLPPRAQ